MRGEPIRGRVGQPSVPLSINPEGAFFLGLKVGRRSADLVLVDFLGTRDGAPAPQLWLAPAGRHRHLRQGGHRRTGLGPRSAPAREGRRPRRRHAVPALELGRGHGGAPRANWRRGARSTSRPRSPRSAAYPGLSPERRDCRLRRRTRLRRAPVARPISSISTSAPSSAAGSCSTAGSMRAARAMPARSVPCRFPGRTASWSS